MIYPFMSELRKKLSQLTTTCGTPIHAASFLVLGFGNSECHSGKFSIVIEVRREINSVKTEAQMIEGGYRRWHIIRGFEKC